MHSRLRTLRYCLGSALLGAAVAVFFGLSWPISSVSGDWQIQDWYEHPNATKEQLAAYTAALQQYPRRVQIRPFWRATVGANSSCSWSQGVNKWSVPAGTAGVWTTTVVCDGKRPIVMYVPPSSIFTRARTPLGLYEFYSDMGKTAIEIVFFTERGPTYINYIPASWPGRPGI
jgi:hypothetical protein